MARADGISNAYCLQANLVSNIVLTEDQICERKLSDVDATTGCTMLGLFAGWVSLYQWEAVVGCISSVSGYKIASLNYKFIDIFR